MTEQKRPPWEPAGTDAEKRDSITKSLAEADTRRELETGVLARRAEEPEQQLTSDGVLRNEPEELSHPTAEEGS